MLERFSVVIYDKKSITVAFLKKYWDYISLICLVCLTTVLFVFGTSASAGKKVTLKSLKTLEEKAIFLRKEKLGSQCEHLKALHQNRKAVKPGDWLHEHHEDGQSFATYVKERPNGPDKVKKFIYIQLIGGFTKDQSKILDQTIEYMQLSFGLSVKKLAAFPLSKIPANARRTRRGDPRLNNDYEQLYTKFIMNKVLLPNRPKDAVALIGFTGTDLYPDPNWNFVFGIASLRQRIGLWSIYRNGNPSKGPKEFIQCLRRTIGTAIHETGHILGMQHCIAYECLMCGSNSRQESDSRELYYCPSCLQKLTWNTKVSPATRFKKLIKLCNKLKLDREEKFFTKSLELLKNKNSK